MSDNRTKIKRGRPKSEVSRRTLARTFGISKSSYAETLMLGKYIELYPQLYKATKGTWALRVVREIRKIEKGLIWVDEKYSCRSFGFNEETKKLIYQEAINNLLDKKIKIGNLKK